MRDESGATAVEYGLIVAGVGMVFIVVGPMLGRVFLTLLDAVTGGMVG